MKRIYLDYNSTTPIDPAVVEAMRPFWESEFGNPSNIHSFGRAARAGLEEARSKVARAIGAKPEEIYFTSGGTEANNWAIKGVAWANRSKGNHIITSQIEHSSVLETCRYLERTGFELTYLGVDEYGMVDPESLRRALRKETLLVSIMHSNNEVGTIQPIPELSRIAHNHGVLFHTDAIQSLGKVAVSVSQLGVDLLTLSGHKIHGPKGVGCLYCRKGTRILPLLHGGHHERNLRAGTENLTGIVGMGRACEILAEAWPEDAKRMKELRDGLEQKILEAIPKVKLNGHPKQRLPNTLNISIGYVEGEALLMQLDLEGIAVSSGSACSSGTFEPSPVLTAMGLPQEYLNSPLRISLGRETTQAELDELVAALTKITQKLRALSPLWIS
jgi:cysteine desulfurase